MERSEFLARRKSGIGGSDVGVILGVNPWKTPYQLWLDKTSDTVEEINSDILHFGQVLEEVVADEYAIRNDVKVHRVNKQYQLDGRPLVANIDRKIVNGGILECKTCDKFAAGKFGESGTDQVPETYLLQVQHYMYVTGIHEASLAVLIGGNEYRQFEIPFDDELATFAANKCCEWWKTYVIGNTRPPATVRDDLAAYYAAKSGATITATPYIADLCGKIRDAKAAIKAQEMELDDWQAELKNYLGENEVLLNADGAKLATWKQAASRNVVDYNGICGELSPNADILAKYTTTKPGNRTLLIK